MSTSPTKAPSSAQQSSAAGTKAGMPFGQEDPKRRQQVLIASVGGVALVVAAALLFIFRPWEHPAPKIGGEPAKLGQYVSTPDFQKMPFEKREIYMKMMHAKKEQIVKAYTDGQLSIEDYQKSLLAAHLGKQLDDMRKYFAKPLGADRTKYLDKLIAKNDAKDDALKHNAAAKEEAKEQDLLKDDAAERAEVASWPADVQSQYQQFRTALSERKKLHKAEKQAKAAPATQATQPQQ